MTNYNVINKIQLEEPIRKGKPFQRIFVRFAERTSMQGVPYIYYSKSTTAKCTWFFLLLVAIGWMVFHLYYLTSQYLQMPKQTKVKLEFSNLPFPAITICNSNIIRKSKLYMASQELQEIIKTRHPRNINIPKPKRKRKNKNRHKRRSRKANESFQNLTIPSSNNKTDEYQIRDDLFRFKENFTGIYLKENRKTRIAMGHQIEDMLLSCSFDGYKCSSEQFTLTQTKDYGNCFTLRTDSMVARDSGPPHGLSLLLLTENDEYLHGISQGSGLRIQIHPQNSYPTPLQKGFFVPSGFETDVGMRMVNISRLNHPTGSCNEGMVFKQKYNIRYTRSVCQTLCQQMKIKEECGCYDGMEREFFHFINMHKDNWCSSDKEIMCGKRVEEDFRNKIRKCDCQNPCSEIQYKLFTSFRQWPTGLYSKILLKTLCENIPEKCVLVDDLLLNEKRLNLNFLKLDIYFEDLNYEGIDEQPEIEPAQFVSDIGGAIGLWIGLSILSIFEVFQLLCELFGILFKKSDDSFRIENHKAHSEC